ncbi:MAG: aminopeptidase P family protein [Phycisphaeraceae bacterium]|nr:aminopeptidase P family protein [Phycisphaeraceae bacterium]
MAIGTSEYRARRERVMRALKGSVGVVFAGDGGHTLHGRFVPQSDFLYLTGVREEPGAALLFEPKNPDPTRRCVLFLRPRDPDMETWDGLRDPIDEALRKRTGMDRIMRTNYLARVVTMAARRAKKLACLHQFPSYESPVSPDLAVFRKIAERVIGVSIEDRTDILPELRAAKSKPEIDLIKKAIDATAAGHAAAARVLRPGVNERDLHRALERTFQDHGATGIPYEPIVGAGVNSTILHYGANDRPVEAGDLVCIDAAASVEGYAADVTRTYPATGKFTKEQREVYEIVLRAQEAAIRACKPGVQFHEIDGAARAIIEKAGHGDQYMHGIGHHLGLEVHDASPDQPLKPGAVITIEPGIYLRDRKIGVRIEDDVLITAKGATNLTRMIPKGVEEVEAMVGGEKRK